MFAKNLLAATAAVCMMGAAFAAEKPATEGAELGKWTMDAPAAQALAKEKGKPLFVNFTGSDWCGWCKLCCCGWISRRTRALSPRSS